MSPYSTYVISIQEKRRDNRGSNVQVVQWSRSVSRPVVVRFATGNGARRLREIKISPIFYVRLDNAVHFCVLENRSIEIRVCTRIYRYAIVTDDLLTMWMTDWTGKNYTNQTALPPTIRSSLESLPLCIYEMIVLISYKFQYNCIVIDLCYCRKIKLFISFEQFNIDLI